MQVQLGMFNTMLSFASLILKNEPNKFWILDFRIWIYGPPLCESEEADQFNKK